MDNSINSISNQKYNLSGESYNHLYKRFLKRSPMELLAIAEEDVEGKNVLDICCGANMRASKEFLSNGAKHVVSVDNYKFDHSLSDVPEKFLRPKFHQVFHNGVDHYLNKSIKNKKFDIVFCQQGITYIYSIDLVKNIIESLSSDGVFIFNIFKYSGSQLNKMVNKISDFYYIDGELYVESNWAERIGDSTDHIIHHIQFCESLGAHYTKFPYLCHSEIEDDLEKQNINYTVYEDGKTLIFKIFR